MDSVRGCPLDWTLDCCGGVHWAGQCEWVSSGLDIELLRGVHLAGQCEWVSSGLDNWTVDVVSTGLVIVSGCPLDWTLDC